MQIKFSGANEIFRKNKLWGLGQKIINTTDQEA